MNNLKIKESAQWAVYALAHTGKAAAGAAASRGKNDLETVKNASLRIPVMNSS